MTSIGSIDAAFVFLVEQEQPRILVLSLAGIPVLDGVSGTPTPSPRSKR